MYCPGCGSEERQISQYCRACGTDLRVVRASLERPDAITESAVTAREQIGQAIAHRIREVANARELEHVAEDVLPQIEKFLESPEEKRLRRMRAGVITASVGIGVCIPALLLLALVGKNDEAAPFFGMAFILSMATFMIGLGLLINGRLLTQPRKKLKDSSADAQAQSHLDAGYATPQLRSSADEQQFLRSPTTNELSRVGNSVTEHTTHILNPER